MKPHVSVPRQAFADLLQASGSTMTPEEFLATLPETNEFKRYSSRAWAAAFDKYFILVVAVLSVVLLPFIGFTLENIVIAAGLCTVTYYEFRVHRYFRENDPRAPSLGFRNQGIFAACILIYCLYSAAVPEQLTPEDQALLNQNYMMDPSLYKGVMRLFYLVVAVVAGGSQFALACYYRMARIEAA